MPGVDLFVKVLVKEVVVLEEAIDAVFLVDNLSGMTNEKEIHILSFVRLNFDYRLVISN